MIKFDKNKEFNKTPIFNHSIVYHFYENTGIKIRTNNNNNFKPLDKYLFSLGFKDESDLNRFIESGEKITHIH